MTGVRSRRDVDTLARTNSTRFDLSNTLHDKFQAVQLGPMQSITGCKSTANANPQRVHHYQSNGVRVSMIEQLEQELLYCRKNYQYGMHIYNMCVVLLSQFFSKVYVDGLNV